mmetsp:Transcript_64292/g.150737  ORF Transcript_64292/g.150737 Transcript_64292/m.150737 type:complete len:149 (+) Transcript_64292:81-527(+)
MSVAPISDCSTPPPVKSPTLGAKANVLEVATLLSFLENRPLDVPPLTWAQLSCKPQQAVRPPPGLGEPCSLFDATLQLHLTKQCHPCVAFAFKKDRCWKGDACTHCHFCTPEEAKVRRRELQEQARKLKRVRKAVERAERGEDASLWL